MAVDIDALKAQYFTFDAPVPYDLKCGETLHITPVSIRDSALFMSSCGILTIEKNLSGDISDIKKSYLQFLAEKALFIRGAKQQFVNICLLCLGFSVPYLEANERGKAVLVDIDSETHEPRLSITAKEFDDVRRIIMYQNMPNYDDSYVDPEFKRNMEEMDALKSRGVEAPDLERKIAIITAHCGISKAEQLTMCMRAHSVLFTEVCGEVEYAAQKAMAMYAGKSDDVRWIYPKKKDKYADYITSVEDYNKSMGGDGHIQKVGADVTDYDAQINNFQLGG